jgi:hypothetical protein
LGAEFFVGSAVVALVEEVQVGVAESREERITVARAAGAALMIGDDEIVGIDFGGAFDDAFVETALVNLFEGELCAGFLADGSGFDLGGIVKIGAHHEAAAIAKRVHAEQLVRVTVLSLNETPELCLG